MFPTSRHGSSFSLTFNLHSASCESCFNYKFFLSLKYVHCLIGMKWIWKEEKQMIWIQNTGRTKQIQRWKYRLLTTSYLTGGWKYHIHNYRSTWNMEFYLLMPFCFSGFMNIVIGRLNLMLLGLNYKQNDTKM